MEGNLLTIKLTNGSWRYDPASPLGKPGGFGAVFRGLSQADEPVAIKRLHLGAADAAHRELTIARDLSGRTLENVLPILDAGQDADTDGYFIVMPVAECNLDEHLTRAGRVDEATAIDILQQIASGLESASHIVHRDLKPANVLLYQGRWNIADFGIARFVEESTSAQTLKECLSPQFAAPEQWRYEHATPATDVYALGCIAHVLLSGCTPFQGSVAELQAKHLGEAPPQITMGSAQLQTLISMMLRKSQSSRPSLARVRSVLRQAAAAVTTQLDPALERLASAGAAHERKQLEADARRNELAAIDAQRDELARDACLILQHLFEELSRRIAGSVPNARVEHSDSTWKVHVANATLEMEIESRRVVPVNEFARSKWDVICSGAIEVRQVLPVHRRAASLWYTRQKSRSADFRWYEVGYMSNPITGKAFEFEPTALGTELADRAHWEAMDIVQTAYAPVAIDDEDCESFYRRWAHLLALAAESRLKMLPLGLPIL